MKKKLLQTALLALLSVIWLFPFPLETRGWVTLSGALVSYLCLVWIPQRAAAVTAAAAVSLGMCFYDGAFISCFLPGVAACALFPAAVGAPANVPLKKDGVMISSLLFAVIGVCGGVLHTLFFMGYTSFRLPAFSRQAVLSAAVFVLLAVLFAASLRRRDLRGAAGKKAPDAGFGKLSLAFGAMLACCVSSVLFFLKQGDAAGWCLFSVFLCGFTALSQPNAAVDALLKRSK